MRSIEFCLYARERQSILDIRRSGVSRPWTKDPILQSGRFCNVYREDDVTTAWFRQFVRSRYDERPEVLLATVVFRWFNRISTGEAIFRQLGDYTENGLGSARTAFDQYLIDGRSESLRMAVLRACGSGPYVTGAYIIKTPNGMNKLDGVLQCIDWFNEQDRIVSGSANCVPMESDRVGWRRLAENLLSARNNHESCRPTLESVWEWLRMFPFLGDFMAYEIVTDLRHTRLLSTAPDIYTWANPGPGAMRGLNRLHGRPLNHTQPKHVFVCEMRELLRQVNEEFPHVWPHRIGFDVEMRDIEHTLCEFDKYERVRLGEGKMKQRYNGQ